MSFFVVFFLHIFILLFQQQKQPFLLSGLVCMAQFLQIRIPYKIPRAPSEDSDQPARTRSLVRVLPGHCCYSVAKEPMRLHKDSDGSILAPMDYQIGL